MPYLVLEGVKPWDGRYPFDLGNAELTTREWGWLKRLTGYMPMTFDEGWQGGDPELFACFAVIALRRAGRIENGDVAAVYDRILDAPFIDTVRFERDEQTGEQEDDAGPPAPGSRKDSSAPSSGNGSTPSSETSPAPANGSGTPASAGSASAPERSAT